VVDRLKQLALSIYGAIRESGPNWLPLAVMTMKEYRIPLMNVPATLIVTETSFFNVQGNSGVSGVIVLLSILTCAMVASKDTMFLIVILQYSLPGPHSHDAYASSSQWDGYPKPPMGGFNELFSSPM